MPRNPVEEIRAGPVPSVPGQRASRSRVARRETALNINLVLRWEYMLGSTLFLVYTRSEVPTTVLGATDVASLNLGAVGRAPASDVVLAKVSFWWGL